jgi:UDP-glucose 4-epimerase
MTMILVTGGAGYIGSAASLALIAAGHGVVVYDDLSRGHRDLAFGAVFVEGDIRSRNALDAVFRAHPIDGVVHFAARSLVGESMERPDEYYDVNVAGTLALLEVMKAHGVKRLVFSSSAAVYGEPDTTVITEDAPLAPANPYGESKAFVETAFRRFHDAFGLKSVSLRYFNAAGADVLRRTGEHHEPETHLIPVLLDVALGRRDVATLFGTDYPTKDGTCIRDYVHVSDLASAHVSALERLLKGKGGCEAFNLGNGTGYSVREVIDTVRAVTGHPVPVAEAGRRSGDPAVLVASSKRAERTLGWKRAFPAIEDIVRTAWEWHRRRFGPKKDVFSDKRLRASTLGMEDAE